LSHARNGDSPRFATFPRLPEPAWQSLDRLFGADDAESSADVELIIVVMTSLAIVLVATWAVKWIWRRAVRSGRPMRS
jgi:hypothetical protein